MESCVLASLADQTPEGKSIIELAVAQGLSAPSLKGGEENGMRFIDFTAETRSSGVDLPGNIQIRKGAYDSSHHIVSKAGNPFPDETTEKVKSIASNGGTPLVVSHQNKVWGVIELQDIIKPGIQERFDRLRKMGVKTVMVNGDNPLTAKYIAQKAPRPQRRGPCSRPRRARRYARSGTPSSWPSWKARCSTITGSEVW